MVAFRFLALFTFVLAGVVHARESTRPKPFTSSSQAPYSEKWGEYTLAVEDAGELQQRFRIRDAKGHTLQEIRTDFICEVTFPDLDGKGSADYVKVVARPAQNTIADIRNFVFCKRGGLRNVLVMPHDFHKVQDLDEDGFPELISYNGAPFEWIGPLCHAANPPLFMVLKWNGKAYEFKNRAFPKTVREHAASLARALEPRLRTVLKTPPEDPAVYNYLLGEALGYWATLATIGEEKVAEEWVRTRMDEKRHAEFVEALEEMRERLETVPKMIGKGAKAVVDLR